MTPETAEAMRRVRAHVDAWIAAFGAEGMYPRIGTVPALAISDLNAVLEEAEGPHEWALVSGSYWDEEDHYPHVHKTFLHEEEVRAAFRTSSIPGVWVGWWDENGVKSCWRQR